MSPRRGKTRPYLSCRRWCSGQKSRKNSSGGLPLHHYANLYVNARNPMLYRNCHEQSSINLCVLRISKDVLSLPGVVVTDGNAATTRTRFHESPTGFQHLDKELVFADYWTDNDPIVADRKKWIICAEVLVPYKVESRFLIGTFVVSTHTAQSLTQKGIHLSSEINRKMFFWNE